jgi:DNA-binding GntR family transcriptional regulator
MGNSFSVWHLAFGWSGYAVSTPRFLTLSDQVTEHLRGEIQRGRWSGTLPGKHQLAAELGVNNKTVEASLWQLEKTGLLLPQGAGRNRLINPRVGNTSRALRIALLLNDNEVDESAKLIQDVRHAIDARWAHRHFSAEVAHHPAL